MSRFFVAFLIVICISAAVIALGQFSGMPMPRNTKPPTSFSSIRAIDETHALLPEVVPHPVGSPQNRRVREGIVHRLQALGYQVTLNSGDACSPLPNVHACAYVENVLARQEGDSSGGTVLLSAHYDSVPTGPGVADDLVNVGTLLEIARIFKASGPHRRGISFLLTDGEEPGLLGADLFVRTLLREVKPVADINLEARGTSGPSLMFETGPKNASLIHAYANSAPFPHAASYFTTMYTLGPNHTDYTVFKKAGVPGLNFAFIEQSENYHRMTDDFAHLDARSVEGQGRTALAAAELLTDATDLSIATGNSVFLDLLHQTVLRWPATATWPVTLFLWLLFAYSGWKVLRNRASWKRFFLQVLAALGCSFLLLPFAWATVIYPFKHLAKHAFIGHATLIAILLAIAALVVVSVSSYWLREVQFIQVLFALALVDLVLLSLAADLALGLTSLFFLQTLAAVFLFALLALRHRPFTNAVWVGSVLFAVAAVVLFPAVTAFFMVAGLQNAPWGSLPGSLLILHALPLFSHTKQT